MTVASALNRKTYAGDDVTTSFGTSPVVFFETSNLQVYVVNDTTGAETLLTENTDYTVSGGDGSTGTVNLAGGSDPHGALLTGTTLVILRVLPYTQTDDLVNNSISDAEVVEERFDRTTMMIQQLAEELDRVVKLSPAETGTDALTELPFDRAGQFLAFDASKNPIAAAGTTEVPVSTFMETLLDDANAPAGRATLGAAGQAEADFKVTQTANPARELTLSLTALTASRQLAVQDKAGSIGVTSEFAYSNVAGSPGRMLFPRMWISGLTYARAADTDHDTTISAGEAMDDTNAQNMILSAALTKQIDAAWAVGTNQGGMDTGSVGNSTWYYIWLIKRSDTGVVDALYSASSSSPTMPANYDYKRLIGAVRTDGSANILGYTTLELCGGGLYYRFNSEILDVDSTTQSTTQVTNTLTLPSFTCLAELVLTFLDGTQGTVRVYPTDATDIDVTGADIGSAGLVGTISARQSAGSAVGTGSQARIKAIASRVNSRAGAAIDRFKIITCGFEWGRR